MLRLGDEGGGRERVDGEERHEPDADEAVAKPAHPVSNRAATPASASPPARATIAAAT